MGNNSTRNNTASGVPEVKPEGETSNFHSQIYFKSAFAYLLKQNDFIEKSSEFVLASTFLSIFPAELKHIGEEFLRTVTHQVTRYYDESAKNTTDQPEIIGDSSVVTGLTDAKSASTSIPDGSADKPVNEEDSLRELIPFNERQFLRACENVSKLDDDVQKTFYYANLCNKLHPTLNEAACVKLMQTCCVAAMLHAGKPYRNTSLDERIVTSLTHSLFTSESVLTAHRLHDWIVAHDMRLFDGLHAWLINRLQHCDTKGDGLSDDQALRSSLCDTLSWILTMTLPDSYFSTNTTDDLMSLSRVQKKFAVIDGWELLYDSDQHGLSINRFEHHVLAYNAPSLLLIVTDTPIFYITCATEWRKGCGKFGGQSSCLQQILPKMLSIQDANLLNWVDRQRDPARGLAVHKSGSSSPAVFIPHDFSCVKYYGVDYPIQLLQVFGCGDESARNEQIKQKRWERREVERSQQQKLHLEQNWAENADKKILEMAGIQTSHAQR